MPRWPVKEKEPEKKFDLMEHIRLGELLDSFHGFDIHGCSYYAAESWHIAVVAMLPDRPVLCHDMKAAQDYIKNWRKHNAGKKGKRGKAKAQGEVDAEAGEAKEEEGT